MMQHSLKGPRLLLYVVYLERIIFHGWRPFCALMLLVGLQQRLFCVKNCFNYHMKFSFGESGQTCSKCRSEG